jgi:hypothetical protein
MIPLAPGKKPSHSSKKMPGKNSGLVLSRKALITLPL